MERRVRSSTSTANVAIELSLQDIDSEGDRWETFPNLAFSPALANQNERLRGTGSISSLSLWVWVLNSFSPLT